MRRGPRRVAWLVLGAGLALRAATVSAEPQGDHPGLSALAQAAGVSGSLRAGYWSSSRNLDDEENLATLALWLRAEPRLGPNLSLAGEGWVRNENLSGGGPTRGKLREAYVDGRFGPLDLRAGKQIIVWGRADRVNPTDNLTPRDFALLVPEDDDQRFGAVAVRASYFLLDRLSLTGIWLATFEPDRVPIAPPPSGVTLREREPKDEFRQWAVKIEQTGTAVDWSVSYVDGFDLLPDLAIGRAGPSGLEILLNHNRIRVVGADAAAVAGRYGLRGEVAYTFTEDSRGTDPSIKNPFLFVVLGGDRTFFESLNVNVQYLLRVVQGFRDPEAIPSPLVRQVAVEQSLINNQVDRVQHAATLRVSNRWFDQTLEGDLSAIVSFTRFGYNVRPKLTYAFTDRLKGVVGADLFGGDRGSFLERFRDNSAVFVELRWSF